MEEKRTCKTCNEIQSNPEATLSTCNYCGDQTCFTCLDTGRHAHDGRLEAIAFIFCLPCEKVQPISSKTDDKPCCSVCKFEWAPRAIIGGDSSNKGQAICSFCGALQTYMTLPFHCGKCASRLL